MAHLRNTIYRTHQVLDAAYAMALSHLDITPQQFLVLDHIAIVMDSGDDAAPSQTDLVNSTGIDRSTMADIVRRLCGKGHIARKRNRKDARAYCVTLTPAGTRVCQTARTIIECLEDDIAERSGCPALAKQLAKVITAAQRPAPLAAE